MASVLAAPHCLGHRLWTCYNTQLQRRPLLVNCATSATLWAAGDLLAERIQRTSQRHAKPAHSTSSGRRHRTAYTSVFGGLVFGPLGHVWYAWLDTVAASFGVPGSLRYILGKVLVDTSMWTPVYVGLFIAYSSLLINRDGVGGTMEKLRQDFAPTMIAEAAIWPPVMALLFARVPASHQLLAVNAVTVADVALISWLEEHSPAELLAQVTGSPSEGSPSEEPGSEDAGPTGRWSRSPSPSP